MKKPIFITVILAVMVLFFSCKTTKLSRNKNTFDYDVIQIVNKMTTRQKIGQVLMLNFRYCKFSESLGHSTEITDFEDSTGKTVKVVPLTYINQTAKTIIQEYHIGNVILFAENLSSIKNTLEITSQLQMLAKQNYDLPMIISVDQEGGRVNRFFQTTIFPSAKIIAETKNPKNAYIEGTYLAEQLKALGINLNFAPVCDLNSNPKNSVIGDRSFSSSPKIAGTFSQELQKGLKDKNVIPCAKHFPGHGDTEIDSHIGLPLVNRSKSQWLELEAIPFKMNIEQEIPVIMTAHIQYPGLDNSKIIADKTGKSIIRPATLSKKILTDILRNELNYQGVICTDALDMKAISKNFSESLAIIEALNAGADLICNPISVVEKKDIERLEKIYCDIEDSLKNGTLSKLRLDDAAIRIVQLKKNYGILDTQYHFADETDFKNAQQILSNSKYQKFKNSLTN